MVKINRITLPKYSSDEESQSDLPRLRKAPWLLSPYAARNWIVSDTSNQENVASIDFNFRLADGRSLVDAERLYSTVKEFAFFARDSRFSVIDDALTHAGAVRNLMHIAHALTLNNIWSFAHLQPFDLENIVEDCRYGVDALIHASERLEQYLYRAKENGHPLRGLPLHKKGQCGGLTKAVNSAELMKRCNLPDSAKILPGVSFITAKAAADEGLRGRTIAGDAPNTLKNVTVQSMLRWLMPIEQLYAMKRHISADAIEFKPFPYGASKIAKAKGVGTERTPTPPPLLALDLFTRASKTVFDFNANRSESLDHVAKRHVFTACWIIIAAFSARRREEIDDLRYGCIRGDISSGYWLDVYIEKTLQRKEWIPVPEVVARAVEILVFLSAIARELSKTDKLFQYCDTSGEIRPINAGKYLDDFALAVDLPMHRPKNGPVVRWHWSPHQFRRFFAILYFYRFEDATVEALSHFLRHFNLEMTKRYVTQDPEVAAIWTDVEWGYMGHVARGIVAGERSVGGAAGNKLRKLAARITDALRQKVHVVDPERVGASLTLLMQRKGLVLTPKPWVTCSCPATADAGRKAACRALVVVKQDDGIGPCFAHAGPTICSSCPHAITEMARGDFLSNEISHLSAATKVRQRVDTVLSILEKNRLVQLTAARDTHYGGPSIASSSV